MCCTKLDVSSVSKSNVPPSYASPLCQFPAKNRDRLPAEMHALPAHADPHNPTSP